MQKSDIKYDIGNKVYGVSSDNGIIRIYPGEISKIMISQEDIVYIVKVEDKKNKTFNTFQFDEEHIYKSIKKIKNLLKAQ